MKKTTRSILSLLLASLMLASTLTACGNGQEQTTQKGGDEISESQSSADTEGKAEADTTGGETEKSDDTSAPAGDVELENSTYVSPECTDSEAVDLANRLANGVNVYYPDSTRQSIVMENMNMSLD